MSYAHLKRGDVIPTVGVLQLLLNRQGESLSIDGNFGPKTEGAVKRFQSARTLSGKGAVNKATWKRLVGSENLPIVDSIDVTKASDFSEVTDARKAGARVVYRAGMSNGVAQAIHDIGQASHNLFLVRMHGHGAAGNIGFSEGEESEEERSGLDLTNLSKLRADLSKLKAFFGPYASVELMGCNTGEGSRGRRFLRKLAAIWDVPVSAGKQAQYSGSGLFRFEGPVVTACPGGKSLKSWCRGLPKFAEMSVR